MPSAEAKAAAAAAWRVHCLALLALCIYWWRLSPQFAFTSRVLTNDFTWQFHSILNLVGMIRCLKMLDAYVIFRLKCLCVCRYCDDTDAIVWCEFSLIDKVEIGVDNIEEMCVRFNYDVFDLGKLITHVYWFGYRKRATILTIYTCTRHCICQINKSTWRCIWAFQFRIWIYGSHHSTEMYSNNRLTFINKLNFATKTTNTIKSQEMHAKWYQVKIIHLITQIHAMNIHSYAVRFR